MTTKPRGNGVSTANACPFCGSQTEIERESHPGLASVSVDEFATLVMNEWRRRLGRAAYDRPQPESLVRALVAFALDPENSATSDSVDAELAEQVRRMHERTASQREMWWELIRLSQAMWDVISWTDLEFDRGRELMERIDSRILRVLERLS